MRGEIADYYFYVVKSNRDWRIRTNKELQVLYGDSDLVTKFLNSRLWLLEYVGRWGKGILRRKYLYEKFEDTQVEVGVKELIDDMGEDLRRVEVREWNIRDRVEWSEGALEARIQSIKVITSRIL